MRPFSRIEAAIKSLQGKALCHYLLGERGRGRPLHPSRWYHGGRDSFYGTSSQRVDMSGFT